MPNYLALGQSVANAVTVGQDFDVSGQQLQTAGINAGVAAITALSAGQDPISAALGAGAAAIPGASTIASAVGAVGGALGIGGIGGFGGSKPGALHTEYASGAANWAKPYGAGTDIIFYLQRAGGGGGGGASGGTGLAGVSGANSSFGGALDTSISGVDVGSFGSALEAATGADVANGFSLPDGMQSALSQVGVSSQLSSLASSFTSANSGLAGPFTGLASLSVPPGLTSAASAFAGTPLESVANVTEAAKQAFQKGTQKSIPGSESFFHQTLSAAFNTVPAIGRTAEQINRALEQAPVSEFSSMLAKATGYTASTAELIEGINHSQFGFSTQGSNAEANRTGPQGLSPRTK